MNNPRAEPVSSRRGQHPRREHQSASRISAGYGSSTRARTITEHERSVCAAVALDGTNRPKAKGTIAQRKSRGGSYRRRQCRVLPRLGADEATFASRSFVPTGTLPRAGPYFGPYFSV